jgi:hypothetical protein
MVARFVLRSDRSEAELSVEGVEEDEPEPVPSCGQFALSGFAVPGEGAELSVAAGIVVSVV